MFKIVCASDCSTPTGPSSKDSSNSSFDVEGAHEDRLILSLPPKFQSPCSSSYDVPSSPSNNGFVVPFSSPVVAIIICVSDGYRTKTAMRIVNGFLSFPFKKLYWTRFPIPNWSLGIHKWTPSLHSPMLPKLPRLSPHLDSPQPLILIPFRNSNTIILPILSDFLRPHQHKHNWCTNPIAVRIDQDQAQSPNSPSYISKWKEPRTRNGNENGKFTTNPKWAYNCIRPP